MYLFLAALGLRCRAWAFSSCSQRLFSSSTLGVASVAASTGSGRRRAHYLWHTDLIVQQHVGCF